MEFRTANEVVPLDARYMLYPVIGSEDPLGAAQFSITWCGLPVPLRPTVAVDFVDELLVTVNCPVAAPTANGSNVSVMFID